MNLIRFIFVFLVCLSCKPITANNNLNEETFNTIEKKGEIITYELLPAENEKGLLILFPGFGGDSERVKAEFKISEKASEAGLSLLIMNYSNNLYLKDEEKEVLKQRLESILKVEGIKVKNITIGGFSVGGNVALLLSHYLLKTNSFLKPKQVFVVDSPVDLLALYNVSKKNITLNFSEAAVTESKWIIDYLGKVLGNPDESISKYEYYSPFTSKTSNIHMISELNNCKVRFYTEPDLSWWKSYRNNTVKDLNAYYLEQLYLLLSDKTKNKKIELIKTENKGYRNDGNRHPHSWSIVEVDDLLRWILKR